VSVPSGFRWGDDDRQESTHGECQPNAGDEPIDAVLVRVAAKGVRGFARGAASRPTALAQQGYGGGPHSPDGYHLGTSGNPP